MRSRSGTTGWPSSARRPDSTTSASSSHRRSNARWENYARQVAQRATRLPAGDAEPPPPAALVDLDADIVVLLSRQDILSYTWPLPRVSPRRYLVVIRAVRGPYRTDAMVTRHVVAHELGHALGLDHNAEPHTLMCGPCQPLTAEPDATGFLPLTVGDRARLVELHGR